MRRFTALVSLLVWCSLVLAQQSVTPVPNLISYSGTLQNSRAAAASTGVVGVTFAIYKQPEGGAPLWLETQNVTVDSGGHYSVSLGSSKAEGVPAELFSAQEERWLGVQAEGQPEQARVMLVSVPYALKAAEADKLGGHSADDFVTSEQLQAALAAQTSQQKSTATPSNKPPSGVVTSFNGRVGDVLPQANDYSFSQLSGSIGALQFKGKYISAINLTNPANLFTGATINLTGNGTFGGMVTATNVVPLTGAVVGNNLAPSTAGGSAGLIGYNINDPSGTGSYGENQVQGGGTGVFGNDKSTTGLTAGVYGQTKNPNGAGGAFSTKSTQAGAGLIAGLDSNQVIRFLVDNQGTVKVTTGTTTMVTAPISPVNHARASILITLNQTYTVDLSWAFPFPDTNYTVTCSPQATPTGPTLYLFQVSSISKTGATVDLAGYPNGQTIVVHCMAMHD